MQEAALHHRHAHALQALADNSSVVNNLHSCAKPTVESSRKRSIHHPQNGALYLGPVLPELIHRGLPGIECLAQEAVLHFLQDACQFVPICILLGRNAVPLTQGHTTESPEKVQKSLVAEFVHVRTHFRPLFPLLESIVAVFSEE